MFWFGIFIFLFAIVSIISSYIGIQGIDNTNDTKARILITNMVLSGLTILISGYMIYSGYSTMIVQAVALQPTTFPRPPYY